MSLLYIIIYLFALLSKEKENKSLDVLENRRIFAPKNIKHINYKYDKQEN